jgi:type IV secretory pathway TrbD component
MSATTDLPETDAITEPGSNALLFGLGVSMLIVALLACVLIVEATTLWLLVAFGSLLVMLGFVAAFIVRFIGETDDGH